ncbi:MAG TPA: hypothetical protein VMY37_04880 [Thermoguttaceae bacterium]|nr:hypothetical protein [Thermoguttaceae bacterium]
MSCLVCSHRWDTEAVWEDGSACVLDDLCPHCQAQGEPIDVVEGCW